MNKTPLSPRCFCGFAWHRRSSTCVPRPCQDRHLSSMRRLPQQNAQLFEMLQGWVDVFYLFPTCQVRVVRFYHSCSSSASAASSSSSFLLPPCFLPRQSSSPICFADLVWPAPDLRVCTPGPQPQGSDRSVHPWTSTARIRSQCASLDLNRKDPIAVCIPGPQPQGSDRSVHRWTSTARIRSQCAPLDLNRKDPIAVCTAGPQLDSLPDKIHKHTITNTRPQTHNHKHTTTNTITNPQSQTHNYKHNYKDTITNT